MQESMRARGPDGAGLWADPQNRIVIGHRRLAILDLTERGAQPMVSADGRYVIAFNGEIYNHPDLRVWCENRGASYRSDTDTETLLHLYALQGTAMLRRLRGMFAFALWDAQKRSLLLARDTLGIKPLYYSNNGEYFAFASQVKALQAGGFAGGTDPAGLVSFLVWGYVTDPHTIDRSIQSLPAGHMLEVRPGKEHRLEQYSDALEPLRTPSDDLDGADLRSVLSDSVQHHLLSDVPVGLFLSSGLDSTAICALSAAASPRPELRAVTLGFQEYAGTENDEVPGAAAIARLTGVEHRVVQLGPKDFAGERERLLRAMDQPTVDGVNTYLVSMAAARQGLKVALSGVGGDELFGSYPSYRQLPRMAAALSWIPPGLGRASRQLLRRLLPRRMSPKYAGVFEYGGSVPGAYLLRRALYMPWELTDIVDPDLAREGLERLDLRDTLNATIRGIDRPFDQVMALEVSVYMRNCLLRDADWAGMAHSLEIRTPLADAELYRQVLALRAGNKGRPLTKYHLRVALGALLDPKTARRKKTGFNVPTRQWITAEADENQFPRGLRPWAVHLMNTLDS